MIFWSTLPSPHTLLHITVTWTLLLESVFRAFLILGVILTDMLITLYFSIETGEIWWSWHELDDIV
jgi:hypothetical protein